VRARAEPLLYGVIGSCSMPARGAGVPAGQERHAGKHHDEGIDPRAIARRLEREERDAEEEQCGNRGDIPRRWPAARAVSAPAIARTATSQKVTTPASAQRGPMLIVEAVWRDQLMPARSSARAVFQKATSPT
jgi:hypothetical protein